MDEADSDDVTIIDVTEPSCILHVPGHIASVTDSRSSLAKQTTESPKRKSKMGNVSGNCISDSSSESTPKKIKGHKTPNSKPVKDKTGEVNSAATHFGYKHSI